MISYFLSKLWKYFIFYFDTCFVITKRSLKKSSHFNVHCCFNDQDTTRGWVWIHSFFIRTKFISMPRLKFGKILRTFWCWQCYVFSIVLNLRYWGSNSFSEQRIKFFGNFQCFFLPKMKKYKVFFSKLNKNILSLCLSG